MEESFNSAILSYLRPANLWTTSKVLPMYSIKKMFNITSLATISNLNSKPRLRKKKWNCRYKFSKCRKQNVASNSLIRLLSRVRVLRLKKNFTATNSSNTSCKCVTRKLWQCSTTPHITKKSDKNIIQTVKTCQTCLYFHLILENTTSYFYSLRILIASHIRHYLYFNFLCEL